VEVREEMWRTRRKVSVHNIERLFLLYTCIYIYSDTSLWYRIAFGLHLNIL